LHPPAIARLLKAVCEREQPGLMILGKQAIDDDASQVGQMLAALMNCAQATFASKLEIAGNEAIVTREIDGGLEIIAVTLPAVITTDLRLNTPRYVTLPNIMKAKKKPLDIWVAEQLGVDHRAHWTVLKTAEPPSRKAGERVKDVDTLIHKLKSEAKVI
jgi:electron transfer flavoprotein beta subunit